MKGAVMAVARGKTNDEAQIRNLIDSWADAVRAQDVESMMSSYSPDVISFDAVGGLQLIGAKATRKRAEEWVSSFSAPIGYVTRDLAITAGQDVAFSHSLNQVSGTTKDGKLVDMWVRATIGFRKVDGEWLVTHEHISVPFDPRSGKALMETGGVSSESDKP